MLEVSVILGVIILITLLKLIFARKKDKKQPFSPIIKHNNTELEQKLIDLINIHRIELELPPLFPETLLYEVGFPHVDYMIKKQKGSHDFSQERFEKINSPKVSEVVAVNYRSVEGIFQSYLDSEEHKERLETREFNYCGCVIKADKDKLYNIIMLAQ
jgi:uncharacterized protein YkwD